MSERQPKRGPGRPRKAESEKANRGADRHKARRQLWVPAALHERLDRVAFHEDRPLFWQGRKAIEEHVSAMEKAKGLPPIAEDEAWQAEKRKREEEKRPAGGEAD